LSDLLTAKHVFVNLATASLTKGDVLRQLAAVHSQAHGLETSSILREVLEAERKMPVVLRPGFALAHGAMEKGPRIAMSFGVYPNGVVWTEGERDVKLVAVVLYAKDTQRTWRDYRKRLSMLFHTDADLEDRLVRAREPKEFLSILRNAEIGGVGLEQPPGEMS
jgi:mannitol/fructose-specific phosphotransferase system IIA component (Ntr-type)